MPRSEGIETNEQVILFPFTAPPERMPRSEGIETYRAQPYHWNTPFDPERMPRSEGIETCSRISMIFQRRSPGTNAPIRGD